MDVDEQDLDALVVCHSCHTINRKMLIADGSRAHCNACNHILYQANSKMLEHGIALGISVLLLFFIASVLPMIKIELIGNHQLISFPEVITVLFTHEFYLVGIITALLIYVFPLAVMVAQMAILILLKLKRGKTATRLLLIGLVKILPWNMSHIFLVSVLVALVKLLSYAQIEVGVAFFALVAYVIINLYMAKVININELWLLRAKIHQI